MKKKKLLSVSLLCLFGMIVAGCNGNQPKSQSSNPASDSATSNVDPSTSEPGSESSDPQPSSSEAPVAPTGVSLDKQSANVIKGQTLQLNATVAPENADNKEITWSSDDEDIVTVSKTGLVTAVEVGFAKITAKIKNTNLKAECEISVIKEINSIAISNKSAFDGFIVDDSDSLNITIDPADNATALLNAGVLKVTSSDPTVAAISGLTVTALKAGKSTIKAELFGKNDSFELTVGDSIPGEPYSVLNALTKGFSEAPYNGKSGKDSAITTTCFELTGVILAVSANGQTGYNAILDDGTQAVMLQISKLATEEIPVKAGDYAKVTCKFTNYYGLLEGVSRKAATGDNASWIPSKDVEKIAAPATPITPFLNTPEAMTAEQYDAYYKLCKVNGTKGAEGASWTSLRYVTLDAEYSVALHDQDKGDYKIADSYGLTAYSSIELDEPFDGQKCTFDVILLGANTGKSKSNGMPLKQTPLAVTSFVIDQTAQTIVHGNSLQLTYTTTPAGSYSRTPVWSSSDETVATVDEKGLVTGIYEGSGSKQATIKLVIGEVEKTVVITVFGETVHATAVALDKSSLSLVEGQDATLVATVTPAMVSDQAVWSSSDANIAKVDQNGKVTAVAPGQANIKVKYNETVEDICAVTVEKLSALNAYDGAHVEIVGKLMYKSGKNAIVDDGTGALWAYASANVSQNVGDLVKVTGDAVNYKSNGGIEIGSATIAAASEGEVTPSTIAELTEAEALGYINAYKADKSNCVPHRFVSMRTSVVGGSGGYFTWTLGTADIETKNWANTGIAAGKIYDVEGYLIDFYTSGGKTYLCIAVTKANEVEVTPTGITLDKNEADLEQGASLTLKATVAPEGASGTVTWSIAPADGKVTVDQAGKVTAAADAVVDSVYTVTATIGELSATCAVTVKEASGGGEQTPVTVTMQYTGTTTTNMTETGNAATVGLDASLFTVDAGKGETTNMPGLNKAGDFRLYSLKSASATGHGSYFVVTLTGGTIQSITINFKQNATDAVVYAGSTVVTGTDGTYAINASSFKVENGYKSDGSTNTQVQINSITIVYVLD